MQSPSHDGYIRFDMNTKTFDAALASFCVVLLAVVMFWLDTSLNAAYIRAGDTKATLVMFLLIAAETIACVLAFRFFRRLFNTIP